MRILKFLLFLISSAQVLSDNFEILPFRAEYLSDYAGVINLMFFRSSGVVNYYNNSVNVEPAAGSLVGEYTLGTPLMGFGQSYSSGLTALITFPRGTTFRITYIFTRLVDTIGLCSVGPVTASLGLNAQHPEYRKVQLENEGGSVRLSAGSKFTVGQITPGYTHLHVPLTQVINSDVPIILYLEFDLNTSN